MSQQNISHSCCQILHISAIITTMTLRKCWDIFSQHSRRSMTPITPEIAYLPYYVAYNATSNVMASTWICLRIQISEIFKPLLITWCRKSVKRVLDWLKKSWYNHGRTGEIFVGEWVFGNFFPNCTATYHCLDSRCAFWFARRRWTQETLFR